MSPFRCLGLGLLCALLPLAVAAESPPVTPPSLPESGRVVLVPLNLGIRTTPQLERGMDAVWSEIVRMLDARDPAPASLQRDSARALWAQVVSQDAATQAGGVYEAYAAFARHVAEQVEFSALVIPALVTRRAEIHGQQASWDGVQRLVETPRPTFVDSRAGVVRVDARGSLEAASLHVAVLSPDGELRFEGAGGIALLEELALADDPDEAALRTREESDPFADPDALREGVRVAFERSLAQTPPASAAGDAPSER